MTEDWDVPYTAAEIAKRDQDLARRRAARREQMIQQELAARGVHFDAPADLVASVRASIGGAS